MFKSYGSKSWSTVQMFEIDCTSCIRSRFSKAWNYQIAHMQNLFCTNCVIPLIDLGLLVQNHVQQGIVDFWSFPLYSIKPNLRNSPSGRRTPRRWVEAFFLT